MFTVIGVENVDYTSNKTGRQVQGVKYHCTIEKQSVSGYSVESIYIPLDKAPAGVVLGTSIEPLYNKFGNVSEIRIVG